MEGVSFLRKMVRKGNILRKSNLPFPSTLIKENFYNISRTSLFSIYLPLFRAFVIHCSFTNILKPLVAFLRKKGIKIIVYLDDFLILLNQSKQGKARFSPDSRLAREMRDFHHQRKSLGVADQPRECLGLFVDSVSLSLFLLLWKVKHVDKRSSERWGLLRSSR
jgi:hypothetical protein